MLAIHLNREPRYEIKGELVVMARPYGMRFYTFQLLALDVSLNGALLISNTNAFIPFQVGIKVSATFDFKSKVFERPIHMVLNIARVGAKDGVQYFGTRIISVDVNHMKVFKRDIEKLRKFERKGSDGQSFYP